VKVEICGSWVWVFRAKVSDQALLRAANFKWSYRRGCWYLSPMVDGDPKTRKNDKPQFLKMTKIRAKYGSRVIHL
jgi:hypothetical protein